MLEIPSHRRHENAVRLYDRNFVLALASQTCFVIANTLMTHYARWVEFLGGNLRQVGWVMGIGAASGLLFRPWLAQLINRLGAKRCWGIGYAVFAASSLLNLALVDIGPLIYLARSANVLGAAIVFASGLTYISQIAPEPRRTEAIGILGVGGFLGMLIGPFFGDFLLGNTVDIASRSRESFMNLFVVSAVANAIPALLLLTLRPSAAKSERKTLRISDFFATTRKHWPGTILLVDFAFGVCMAGPFVFAASYIDDTPLVLNGVSELGFFFWCYASVGIATRLTLRRLPDLVGARPVLLAGMLIMTVGMFAYCLVSKEFPWMLAIPAVLTGLGHGLMFHTMTSLTIEPFPLEVRGTGSALALMMLDLGMFLGAPVLGLVGDMFGYAALFCTIAVSTLISAIIYWRFN